MNKKIVIFGGGTMVHFANHRSLCAEAYGTTADELEHMCKKRFEDKMDIEVYKSRMAGGRSFVTTQDVSDLVDKIIQDDTTRVVFFSVAMFDWEPLSNEAGKYADRLKTSEYSQINIPLKPAPKVINKIRAKRKDIFLIGFKTTTRNTEDQQYLAGLNLCKTAVVIWC